jgi:hypothetical protein
MQVPKQMICDNRECKHPLSDHMQAVDEANGISVEDLKTRTFPCLWFDRQTGMFTVCSCRDFELPSKSEAEPDVPDEPVHNLTLEGDIVLVLWASGRVTWDPK